MNPLKRGKNVVSQGQNTRIEFQNRFYGLDKLKAKSNESILNSWKLFIIFYKSILRKSSLYYNCYQTFISFHEYNCTKDDENQNVFQNQLDYIR